MTALTDKIYNDIQVATTIDQADLADILTTLALSEHTVSEVADFTLASTVADALTAIGLGSGDTPTFASVNLSSLTVDTSTLVVDGTNNYVGIGTATPATGLDVALAASFGSTVALTGATSLTATLSTSGSGKIVLGTTSAQTVGALAGAEDLAVNGLGNRAGISVARWSNDTSGSRLTLFHGRGTSVGTYTALQNGDTLGGVYFSGANGSTYLEGAAIRAIASGTPGVSDMTSDLAFSVTSGTTLAEKARLTAAGRMIIGHTATVPTVLTNPWLQVHVAAGIGTYRWSNDANGALLFLTKSRSTTTGTYGTVVQSGDDIGVIYFAADDGVLGRNAASIRAIVDGTPGSADMPGALVFATVADGGSTLLDRMKISNTGLVSFGDTDTGILGYGLSDALAVYTGGTERMRITSNAVVHGATAAAVTLSNIPTVQTHGNGGIGAFRWSNDANPALMFLTKSRSTTTGTFGTAVQSGDGIGALYFAADDGNAAVAAAAITAAVDGTPGLTDMPGRLSFLTSADGTASLVERLRIENGGVVRPGGDNSQTSGSASFRWSTVYAGTGTINTSDARDKVWMGELTEEELAAATTIAAGFGSFKWKDAIELKGVNARRHIGVTAQNVKAAFEGAGLDPSKYALWTESPLIETVTVDGVERDVPVYEEDGVTQRTRMGLRHDQVSMLLLAAGLHRLEAHNIQLANIETRLAALEAA